MSSSTLFITLLFLIYLSDIVSARRRPCDSEGKCKYGGTCGADNTCYCSFNCAQPTWSYSMDSIYCLPPKGSRRMERFMNICFLMTRACELQEDLPLIKMDFSKPPAKRCQDKNADRWHLCPKPEDFMGPCGGTPNRRGDFVDGGVCLKDKWSNGFRCECPNSRSGMNCENKVVPLAALKEEIGNKGESKEDPGQLALIIAIASAAGVFLGLIVFASLRYRAEGIRGEQYYPSRRSKRDFDVREEHRALPGSPARIRDNRSDNGIEGCDQYEKIETSANQSFVVEIDAEINTRTPAENATSAEVALLPRRQRINGFSVRNHKVGDSNNNHTVADTEAFDNTTPLPSDTSSETTQLPQENGELTTNNRHLGGAVAKVGEPEKSTPTEDEMEFSETLRNKSSPNMTTEHASPKHPVVQNLANGSGSSKFHCGLNTL